VMIVREHIKALGKYIKENPDKWTQTEYRFSCGKLDIWTGSSLFYLDSDPSSQMFNVREKFYIRDCINEGVNDLRKEDGEDD